ncbi:hypothetical protein Clacol_005773 [Clathrus columnatus]|uniref:3,4-dihydroxy-2-butanone 4-phosphate synthase n=1 Tax=Clathrus columnatus TaxID=1419009 RepID=A0AAV5AEC8_9AGAM|nr:hypothetical protein Clacol_005773 [Clathrus columnatus]
MDPVPSETQDLETNFKFDDIHVALDAFKRGEFLVVVDDEDRENEGDLICAASLCTTEKMAWMIKYTSGYICISLPATRLEQLDIPMMYPNNQDRHRTAYAVTVDYKYGTTTGISAHDRALTCRMLAAYSTSTPLSDETFTNGSSVGISRTNGQTKPTTTAEAFTRPGHIVPLRARPGGVLERRGHTEAALDLCILTALPSAGILCELVNDDTIGSMARRDDCRIFANRWGIKMISIEQIVRYREEYPL